MTIEIQPTRRQLLAGTAVLATTSLYGAANAAAVSSSSAPAAVPLQKSGYSRANGRTRLDTGWRFAFGNAADPDKDFNFGRVDYKTYSKQGAKLCTCAEPDFDVSGWDAVQIPHDWAVALPFTPAPDARETTKPDEWAGIRFHPPADRGYKPVGREYPATSIGWYRRTLELTAAERKGRVRIDFDGVFRNAIVILNGFFVHEHDGGYTPFSVDLTDFLNTDGKPDILVVRVDATLAEGWFYEGAGIYRHAWLACHDPVHVPQNGVCVRPAVNGEVEVLTTIRNDSAKPARVSLSNAVQGANAGSTGEFEVPAWDQIEVEQKFRVSSPRLWSTKAPNLYLLDTAINGTKVSTSRFGFRSVRFDAKTGFYLNGENIKILGTCNHQDHAGVGSALPDALWYYRLRLLKEMGTNAYRSAHNPATQELLDACDEMGVIVIDETRVMSSSKLGLSQLETLIRTSRNHPSIILWSIGNEEPQMPTQRGVAIARTMKRLANRLDPTRQVTAAFDRGFEGGSADVVDVFGFNYKQTEIAPFHARYPDMPTLGSETASTVATRGEYHRDEVKNLLPAYDTDAPRWANTAEQWWPYFDQNKFLSGGFIWTGFDYRGEPTPYSYWPSISSQFGVFDTCGFPKDNYYYYRAWWRPEPLVHLLPHWNWKPGEKVAVWAHSNCDEVELFLNGKSLGRKPMARNSHLEWEVAFVPGTIEARGYNKGKLVKTDKRETAGEPAAIILTADRSNLSADGQDCAVLRAEVVDAKGRPVPRASDLITFTVAGPAAVIGVGNGDPNCHEADKASKRSAFNGLCSAIVQTGKAGGAITIKATAAGLKSAEVKLRSS